MARLGTLRHDPEAVLPLLALVVVLGVGTYHGQSWQPGRRPIDLLAWVIVAVVGACVALHSYNRTLCFLIATTATAVFLGMGYPYGPVLLCVGVLDALLTASIPLPWSLGVVAIGTFQLLLGEAYHAGVSAHRDLEFTHALALVGWMLGPWAAAAVIRDRWQANLREYDEARRARLDAERMLLAREVHDIVGHGLAVIASQAAIADHLFASNPERAHELLRTIRDVSRSALHDVRIAIGSLGPSVPGADAGPALSPSIGAIEVLGQRVCSEHLSVETTVGEDVDDFGPLLNLTIYRVVQEALTNVVRHSQARHAAVAVSADESTITIRVTDDGNGRHDGVSGHGLAGTADRVLALGGRFHAGPLPSGGWAVVAHLPRDLSNPAMTLDGVA